VEQSFCVTPRYLPLLTLRGVVPAGDKRVAAVAGIARPERFFNALRKQGYDVVREFTFPDHPWFSAAEFRDVEATVRGVGASAIVTTAKDAMRLERYRDALTAPWAILPLSVFVEPSADFEAWLLSRL
jgi:tetraacyldisaccharide 4'-kinase